MTTFDSGTLKFMLETWQPRSYYYPTEEEEAMDVQNKKMAVREFYFAQLRKSIEAEEALRKEELDKIDGVPLLTSPYGVDLSGFTRKLYGPRSSVNSSSSVDNSVKNNSTVMRSPAADLIEHPAGEEEIHCPFCDSLDTRFEGYNNNSRRQPRYRCRGCKERFTHGGKLRAARLSKARRNRSRIY